MGAELDSWVAQAAAGGLLLELEEPPKARWYRVHLQPTLWGDVDLVRQWGRLGTTPQRPRTLRESFADEAGARDGLAKVLQRRAARGYAPPAIVPVVSAPSEHAGRCEEADGARGTGRASSASRTADAGAG
jgi:predicted DNA-binding WGR domain protein